MITELTRITESVSQTLAGRTALLRLHPFSLSELRECRPLDPRNLDHIESGGPPPRSRWETLIAGFYPRIHDKGVPARGWTSIPSNPNRGGVLVHGGAESFEFKGFQVLPWFLQ